MGASVKVSQCKNCQFFKKMRNYSFGKCSNDKMFQYAENKEDLAEMGEDTLIIMGEGEPIVGINYYCNNYVPRGTKKTGVLSVTNDFRSGIKSYAPPAAAKRKGNDGIRFIPPPPSIGGNPYNKQHLYKAKAR